MPYAQFIPNQLVPAWMRGTWGYRWWQTIGAILDTVTAGSRNAVLARMPSTQLAGSDSLDAIGGDRLLPRGLSGAETDSTYATRLQTAWSIWQYGGTAFGVLNALATAGYPTALLFTVSGGTGGAGGIQFSLSGGNLVATPLPILTGYPSIGTWMTRATRSYWSEFQVVFPSAALPSIAGGAMSDWASGLPAQDSVEIQDLVTLIKRWRPAFARCAGIVAVAVDSCWGYPLETYSSSVPSLYGSDAVTLYPVD